MPYLSARPQAVERDRRRRSVTVAADRHFPMANAPPEHPPPLEPHSGIYATAPTRLLAAPARPRRGSNSHLLAAPARPRHATCPGAARVPQPLCQARRVLAPDRSCTSSRVWGRASPPACCTDSSDACSSASGASQGSGTAHAPTLSSSAARKPAAGCCGRAPPFIGGAESSSAFLARAARAARRGSREVLPPGSAAALSASW